MKKILKYTLITLLASFTLASCSKDEDGADNSEMLVGTWSSVRIEGTVSYSGSGGTELAQLVNDNIDVLTCHGMIVLSFTNAGNATLMGAGETQTGKYSYKGTSLSMRNDEGSMNMNAIINQNKDTLRLKLNFGDGIAEYLTEAYGDYVLQQTGQGNSIAQEGMEVHQSTNITLVLGKQ